MEQLQGSGIGIGEAGVVIAAGQGHGQAQVGPNPRAAGEDCMPNGRGQTGWRIRLQLGFQPSFKHPFNSVCQHAGLLAFCRHNGHPKKMVSIATVVVYCTSNLTLAPA